MLASKVRELFDYDADTGVLRWRVARRKVRAGDVAGTLNPLGYVQIGVDYRLYLAHRLAWAYVHSEWPRVQIDHRDGDRANNRIANLRDVSCAVNLQNRKLANPLNRSTGLLGVARTPCGFRAQIRINGKHRYLGTYDTPAAAHSAYIAAKRQHHAGFVEA